MSQGLPSATDHRNFPCMFGFCLNLDAICHCFFHAQFNIHFPEAQPCFFIENPSFIIVGCSGISLPWKNMWSINNKWLMFDEDKCIVIFRITCCQLSVISNGNGMVNGNHTANKTLCSKWLLSKHVYSNYSSLLRPAYCVHQQNLKNSYWA